MSYQITDQEMLDAQEKYSIRVSAYIAKRAIALVTKLSASADVVRLVEKVGEAFIEGVFIEKLYFEVERADEIALELLKSHIRVVERAPPVQEVAHTALYMAQALAFKRLKKLMEDL